MKIICISGKAGHGKDVAARFIKSQLELSEQTVLLTHFGDLVKYVCKAFFGWNGKKDEAGREMLQTIGTDIVRSEDPDYWARFVSDMLGFFEPAWDYVIIGDCRFENELKTLIKSGFDVTHIRVVRSGYESTLTNDQQNHVSETELDDYPADIYVHNDGDIAEFHRNLLLAVDELKL